MIQGMNQAGAAGGAFFAFGFQGATQQVQQAPMNQIQQLQSLFQTAFQSFFQAAGQMTQQAGNGFGQSGAAQPGFVPAPSNQTMMPQNPLACNPNFGHAQQPSLNQANQMGGAGFMFGGFIPFGGGQVGQSEIPRPSGGLEQLGPNKFKTHGGYTIEATGKRNEWTITSPDGKNETKIWGDPHVDVNGKRAFDFKKPSSFVLPDGTKISVDVTPPRKNGYTVTKNIHIQSGSQRASINDIDQNKPTSTGVKNDRYQFDAQQKDGEYIVMGNDNSKWFFDGKNQITGSSDAGAKFKTGEAAGGNDISQAARAGAREVGQPGIGIPGMPTNPGFPTQPTFPSLPQVPGQPAQPGQPGQPSINRPPVFGGQMMMMQMMMQMMQMMMKMMMQQQPQAQPQPGIMAGQ